MAEIHLPNADEVRTIIREELRNLLDELRSVPAPDVRVGTEEAAKRANVKPHTVRAWIRSGRLHATKPEGSRDFQIKLADLAAFLDGSRTPPPDEPGGGLDVSSSARKILERASRSRG